MAPGCVKRPELTGSGGHSVPSGARSRAEDQEDGGDHVG